MDHHAKRRCAKAGRAGLLPALLICAVVHLSAHAAGAPPSSDLPDLAAVRARIYSGEFARVVNELLALADTVRHAEVYNLLGYSLRQLRRFDEAAHWYREALTYDPEHRPALEYQGELFIAVGDIAGARKNLRYLELLCGTKGCAEYDQLKKALGEARGEAPVPEAK